MMNNSKPSAVLNRTAKVLSIVLGLGFAGYVSYVATTHPNTNPVQIHQETFLSPQGDFILAELGDLENQLLEAATMEVSGYLSGMVQDANLLTGISNPELKKLVGKVSYLAARGQIVSAQMLLDAVATHYPQERSVGALNTFLVQSIQPPAHDAAFSDALRIHNRMELMLRNSISDPQMLDCALVELKASMYDDLLAMKFAQQCLKRDEDSRIISSAAATEIQKYMNVLREAYGEDTDHD